MKSMPPSRSHVRIEVRQRKNKSPRPICFGSSIMARFSDAIETCLAPVHLGRNSLAEQYARIVAIVTRFKIIIVFIPSDNGRNLYIRGGGAAGPKAALYETRYRQLLNVSLTLLYITPIQYNTICLYTYIT